MPMSEYMKRLRARIGHDMILIPTATVLTFDDRDRVLLVRHGDVKRWTTAGGAIEPEERPADAAVREMWEETGLHVELTRILGVYGGPEFNTTYSNGDVVTFTMIVFEGRAIGGTLQPDGDETLEVRYFARSELPDLDKQPWVQAVLDDAYTMREQTSFASATWTPPHS